jgi:hypothetical protein
MRKTGLATTMELMAKQQATMQTPAIYRLRVQGRIPLEWSSRMMGMNITVNGDADDERSTLVGRLPDQAALSGILNDLYDRQFPVLSVECLEIG